MKKERYGVDMRKKTFLLGMVFALSTVALMGCGSGNANNSVTDQETQAPAAGGEDNADNGGNMEGGDNVDTADGNDAMYASPTVGGAVTDVEDGVDGAIDDTEDAIDGAADALDGNDTDTGTDTGAGTDQGAGTGQDDGTGQNNGTDRNNGKKRR